jgi:hypothetical protein
MHTWLLRAIYITWKHMLLKQLHCQRAQRGICFEAQVFQDGCSQHGRDLAIDVCGQVHIFLRSNSGLLRTHIALAGMKDGQEGHWEVV